MSVVANRKGMIEVMERIVVPALERKGFTGQFPHFRRIAADRIDLLSLFFNPYGNGFVFKFARCGPRGFVKQNGKLIPAERVTTTHMPHSQLAWISPNSASRGADFWFRYQPSDLESLRTAALDVMPYLLQVDY